MPVEPRTPGGSPPGIDLPIATFALERLYEDRLASELAAAAVSH